MKPQTNPPCVLFAGGGTGGHLFPGIAVAEKLRRRHPDWALHFVGTARGIEVRQVPRYNFPLHLLPVRPLRGRSLQQRVAGLAGLPRAGLEALLLVRRLRPCVAVGVGGYAAGPALLAARALGARCVVMEQNAYAGLTNRLLGRVAHSIALALPNAQLQGPRAHLLGNPVREEVAALGGAPAPQMPRAFTPERPLRIFAFGGSQGARGINEAMLQLAPHVARHAWPVSILHQTGASEHARVLARYAEVGASFVRALPFVDDMAQALHDADLLVCRAGASTLAEASIVGRAALLVPYPHAADDHQRKNAEVFAAAGAAVVLDEKALTPEVLVGQVAAFVAEPELLLAMGASARRVRRPTACADIAALIEREVAFVSQ